MAVNFPPANPDINPEPSPWAPWAGRWSLEQPTPSYLGPAEANAPHPYGLVLSPHRLRNGTVQTHAVLQDPLGGSARIVVGFSPATGKYFSVGLGGYNLAYVVDEFSPTRGWLALKAAGSAQNLLRGAPYLLSIDLRGQRLRLSVNGTRVLEHSLPNPPPSDQIGLFAWGQAPVHFSEFASAASRPTAFVVMQYGEPYDSLFSEVIKPVSETIGLFAYRVADVYRPGMILQDIIEGLLEAEVVIAEITPANANVFYELGYAHALEKPTILLAERGVELPFDIRSFRCIFYDNTIKGKRTVERALRKHLHSILDISDLGSPILDPSPDNS